MKKFIVNKSQNINRPCLVDIPDYPRLTVLVLDSGVGGLSIYNEIRCLLPNLHYIYAFDNIAFPYGEKSEAFIIERVTSIITSIQQYYPLALAIIACNTASIISLPILRKKFQFPVVGVVPAIKPAIYLTTNGIIGLLATYGTVKHPYTRKLIDRFANKCQIMILGSTELVEIVEAKMHGELVSCNKLRRIIYPWIKMQDKPDTIILGCTHFPLLKNELLQVLPEGTLLVDSGAAIAQRISWLLKRKLSHAQSSDANIAFCTGKTKKIKQLLPTLYKYGFKILRNI